MFRSVGAKCVEKTHRSNSVLMNVLRGRPVTASVLQQEVTSRADEEIRPDEQHVKMEQESFQSKHVSGLECECDTTTVSQLELPIRSTKYVARKAGTVLGWIHRRDLYW